MSKFNGQNILEFAEEFSTEEKCKMYLEKFKWGDGFHCPVCNHDQYYPGHKPFTRQCKNCRRIDSVTANTLFHKVKFGLHKAFWIVFEMSSTTKSISSNMMAKRMGISQKTAWFFMQKVRKAMKSSENFPMEGNVHVDEFVIGQKEEGKPGRSRDTKKKKVVCAVEFTNDHKVKRFYAKPIADYSSDEVRMLFDKHIDKKAMVTTDKWTAYQVIASQYNIKQVESRMGKNFRELHLVISSLKSWIRAIPTHVTRFHLQAYLDEFSFRINRSIFKETVFHKLIERMMFAHHQSWQNIVST